MRQELERLYYEEIKSEIEEIGKAELGGDVHVKTAQVVNSMMDKLNDVEKIKNEQKRLENEERKLAIEAEKNEIDKRNNTIKNILTGAIFVVSTGVTIWSNCSAMKFETGGNIHTTEPGKNSTRKLLNLLDKFKV